MFFIFYFLERGTERILFVWRHFSRVGANDVGEELRTRANTWTDGHDS